MNLVYPVNPVYAHRGTPNNPVPSWGREGWFFTPQCVLSGDPAYDRVILQPVVDDLYLAEVDCPSGYGAIARIKSSHLIKDWYVQSVAKVGDRVKVYLGLPDIDESFIGGVFSIAFVREATEEELLGIAQPLLDVAQEQEIAVEFDNTGDWSTLVGEDGKPIQLNPNFLWDLSLTSINGAIVETAWVDPGFIGRLQVPSRSVDPEYDYTLVATPYFYPGKERYQGQYQNVIRSGCR